MPTINRRGYAGALHRFILVGLLALVTAATVSSCSDKKENTSSGAGGPTPGTPGSGANPPPAGNTTVVLNAFQNFSCTPQWTVRDGARGLKAGSGNGTCTAVFNGGKGSYQIRLKAQTERDGASPYRVSINGMTVREGNMPYAGGGLSCNCPVGSCPDVNVFLEAGVHTLQPGDQIEFFGQEDYGCGSHGAYAKWHEIRLEPRS